MYYTKKHLFQVIALCLSTGSSFFLPSAVFAAPLCGENTGAHQALVVPVNYSDDITQDATQQEIDDVVFGANGSPINVADYIDETSYGRASLTGTTVTWLTLNQSVASCTYDGIINEVIDTLSATIDFTQYNKLIIAASPASCVTYYGKSFGCSARQVNLPGGGTATVDMSVSIHRADAFTDIVGSTHLVAHEEGHNFGLPHQLFRDYGNGMNDIVGPIGGYDQGSIPASPLDPFGQLDSMGEGGMSHYIAPHKYDMGWLTDTDLHQISATGTYVIEALSEPLGAKKKAAQIFRGVDTNDYSITDPDSLTKEYFWVETRNTTGYDSYLATSDVGPTEAFGTAIFYHEHAGNSLGERIERIDMHPGSTGVSGDQWVGALKNTETFVDPYTNIAIGVMNTTATDITLSVTYPSSILDTDKDGIPDVKESDYGTNPFLEDSDGDGLTDLWEVCYDGDCTTYDPFDVVTNPTGGDLNAGSPDTDGDALTDDEEVNTHGTNPLLADTDGDGVDDGVEIATGSDPLDSGSVPSSLSGDINDDGLLNVADVLLAQRHVMGLALLSPDQISRGDVYPSGGDGQITIQDVLVIQRSVMSLP